ncbi:hypothetical protein [Paenibacillus peoriae]|uniref:hypothetical protein n=1 Tax=Paenibacillus peoriae TaxID=59893 RepID=UPI00096C35EB|nr:hypothetical protein [Paenibacillus peoriae]OMF31503.1 hypothetical protein BK134_14315 [Paenibacillus peoriae]
MKRKLNLILCFTLLITIFLPLSSVSAYTGGYANGKSVDAMIPDIYFKEDPMQAKQVQHL